jgi:hypothetical protein
MKTRANEWYISIYIIIRCYFKEWEGISMAPTLTLRFKLEAPDTLIDLL